MLLVPPTIVEQSEHTILRHPPPIKPRPLQLLIILQNPPPIKLHPVKGVLARLQIPPTITSWKLRV